MSYNIISLPWIVIDEKVVSSGKVLSVEEIIELLKSNCCDDNSCPETKDVETPKKSCCCSGNC
jgi:hypothetical protein